MSEIRPMVEVLFTESVYNNGYNMGSIERLFQIEEWEYQDGSHYDTNAGEDESQTIVVYAQA